MNGGYILLDCTGIDLAEAGPFTIDGLYAKIVEVYKLNKPVYAYNCVFEDALMTPIQVMITKRPSGNFIATASTLQLEVADDDSVTITNMLA